MSTLQVELYDQTGHPRNWDFPWCLYASFAEAEDTALVRIGISSKVYDRLKAITANCPYIVGVTLWAEVGWQRSRAQRIENALRTAFEPRRTSNGWYRFNTRAEVDKMAFHTTTRMVFSAITGNDLSWKKITQEQIDAYTSLKK